MTITVPMEKGEPMAKNVDIIDVMIAAHRGELKASVSNGYFMLENTKSGERVRLNESDAVPVVHGRWETVRVEVGDPFDGNSTYLIDVFACSVCGVHFDISEARNYCPNCGAKTDLEVE